MTTKQITEKRYVVKLSDEERERLNTLIRAGNLHYPSVEYRGGRRPAH